jgi:ATP-dependent Zn protease
LRLVREERIERVMHILIQLNVLRQVKSIINQYENNHSEIAEPMCEKIHNVLKTLSQQESIYGSEMNSFFAILEKMIFCND